jgi:hypothetical protein
MQSGAVQSAEAPAQVYQQLKRVFHVPSKSTVGIHTHAILHLRVGICTRHLLQHQDVRHAASSMRQAALYCNIKKSLLLCNSYTSEVSFFSCRISLRNLHGRATLSTRLHSQGKQGSSPHLKTPMYHTHIHTHTECLDYIPASPHL